MGAKAIDPQSIRNVTIIGDPDETTRVVHRLFRRFARTAGTVHWVTGRVDHTIRIAELSSHAPIADLERSVRVADAVIAVVSAAMERTPRLETILRLADDHQVARLCLVTGLGHRAADFDRTIAETRGAAPLMLQIPIGIGIGTEFEGVIDLIPMWAVEPMAVEFYGSHWKVAEQWYRNLVATVMEQDPADSDAILGPRQIPPEHLHERIRCLTRIGDAVPVLFLTFGPRNNRVHYCIRGETATCCSDELTAIERPLLRTAPDNTALHAKMPTRRVLHESLCPGSRRAGSDTDRCCP